MAGEHSNRGRKRAREARAAFGLGPTAPVGCILSLVEQRAGIGVIVGALPIGIAGFCDPGDAAAGEAPIVAVDGTQVVPRTRFTLAHEFGHVRIGHGARLDTARTIHNPREGDPDPLEVEANAFAAEFLAPGAGVALTALRAGRLAGLEEALKIQSQFGISVLAAIYALRTSDVIDHSRMRRLVAEYAAGDHKVLATHLELPVFSDRMSALERPYVSPALAGGALAAALAGRATTAEAAAVAGVDAGALAAGIEHLDPGRGGRPGLRPPGRR